jgi:hypothetical protein
MTGEEIPQSTLIIAGGAFLGVMVNNGVTLWVQAAQRRTARKGEMWQVYADVIAKSRLRSQLFFQKHSAECRVEVYKCAIENEMKHGDFYKSQHDAWQGIVKDCLLQYNAAENELFAAVAKVGGLFKKSVELLSLIEAALVPRTIQGSFEATKVAPEQLDNWLAEQQKSLAAIVKLHFDEPIGRLIEHLRRLLKVSPERLMP